MPSAILCGLPPLVSGIHSSLFSDWRRTVSFRFFNIQVTSISSEELCSLSRSLCALSSLLRWTQSTVELLSLQDWQNRESLMQRLPKSVPGHLSSHSALSSFRLFAPLALWRLSVFLRPLFQALESCPASGAPWSSAISPSLGRGWIATTTTKTCNMYIKYVYSLIVRPLILSL